MAVNQRVNVAYGQSQPLVDVFPFPIVAKRDPTANDKAELGTIWLNTVTDGAFILTSIVNNVANWESMVGVGGGIFTSLTTTTGPVHLVSTQNAARSIFLDANGGVLETIEIFAEQGTGAGSIFIHSAVGGITETATSLAFTGTNASTLQTTGAGQDLTLEAQLGSIRITSGEDAAQAIYIHTDVGVNETIEIRAEQGTSTGAIDLLADVGGITATAGTNIIITSTEAAIDAIQITAIDAAGGVQISGGDLVQLETTTNNGNIQIIAAQDAAAAAAITMDTFVGVATLTTLMTAPGATETLTLTNNEIIATSGVLVSVSSTGAEDAQMTITRVQPGAGVCQIKVKNNGAAALNSDLIVSFMVLS